MAGRGVRGWGWGGCGCVCVCVGGGGGIVIALVLPPWNPAVVTVRSEVLKTTFPSGPSTRRRRCSY